jgi:hypothetical protein
MIEDITSKKGIQAKSLQKVIDDVDYKITPQMRHLAKEYMDFQKDT